MNDSKTDRILDALLSAVEDSDIKFDCFYVALYDRLTAQLGFPLVKQKVVDREWDRRSYEPDRLLLDHLLASEESVLIRSSFAAWMHEKKLEYWPGISPVSWLGVPIKAGGRALGVVALEGTSEHVYDERGLQTLTGLVNRTAAYLVNVRQKERLQVVKEVAQALTAGVGRDVSEVYRLIHQQASRLMDTRNMYVAWLDGGQRKLRFPLALYNGEYEDWPSRTIELRDTPSGGLTEEVIRTRSPVCPGDVAGWYRAHNIVPAVSPLPRSWLGVPMMLQDRVLGVVAVQNDAVENLYRQDDQEILETMAAQAAVALADAETRTKLQAVSIVGQELAERSDLSESGILEQVHIQASELMDTRNMYVALYDGSQRKLSFPLAFYKGEHVEWPSRTVELRSEPGGGATEEVLRTRKAFCPSDVAGWYKENDIVPAVEPIPQSWMGVPMMLGERVLGVVAVQNDDVKDLYGQDDQNVLQTMANQATVALENARLREGIADAEEIAVRTSVAQDAVHGLRNSAATIPGWTQLLREALVQLADPIPDDVDVYLRQINANAQQLLQTAEQLNSPPRVENLSVSALLSSMLGQVDIKYTDRIQVSLSLEKGLYEVRADPVRLKAALWSLVSNGVEAILEKGDGILTIIAENCAPIPHTTWVGLVIKDTGIGVPQEDMAKLFTPRFSTKSERRGYGLWRSKMVIERLGGSIEVESQYGTGTTITVLLPAVAQENKNE